MSTTVGTELDKAYEELRGIESEIAVLSGRNQQEKLVFLYCLLYIINFYKVDVLK